MNRSLWPLSLLALAPAALAHHSFAPHFDSSKPVSLEGRVIRFDARNPHAYLHIEVNAEGETQTWVCESHGVTMLARNGVTRDILAPGTRVTVEGSAARRDPRGCFFRVVELEDGTRLNVDGPAERAVAAAASAVTSPADAQSEGSPEALFGTWLVRPRAGAGGGRPDPMSNYFTEAGAAASAAYDPYTDDPVLQCDTIGIRRVWGAVGTPLEITRESDDRISIRYEWMDASRTIHLDQSAPPQGFDADSLGYSIGRFEDGTLHIDTVYARGGIISQFVEVEDGRQIGLLHSPAMETKERLRVDPQTGFLNVAIDINDPLFYTQPFPTTTITYARTDLRVQPFGCIPEVAD